MIRLESAGGGVELRVTKSREDMGHGIEQNFVVTDQDENSFVVEVNGNPGSKIIDITGYNYFHDLVKHVEKKAGFSRKEEETGKDDSTSAQAQLAALEAKQDKGERMSINEVGLMGALRRMIRAA